MTSRIEWLIRATFKFDASHHLPINFVLHYQIKSFCDRKIISPSFHSVEIFTFRSFTFVFFRMEIALDLKRFADFNWLIEISNENQFFKFFSRHTDCESLFCVCNFTSILPVSLHFNGKAYADFNFGFSAIVLQLNQFWINVWLASTFDGFSLFALISGRPQFNTYLILWHDIFITITSIYI